MKTARKYYPPNLIPDDFNKIKPYLEELVKTPLESLAQVDSWIDQCSELNAILSEYSNRLYVKKSCNTEDKVVEDAYMHFVEHVEQNTKPLFNEMEKKFVEALNRLQNPTSNLTLIKKKWEVSIKLYSEKNLPLEVDETNLINEYDKICGAFTATYKGKTYTLQQLQPFMEDNNRAVRKEVWELAEKIRLEKTQETEAVFDKLVNLREQMAKNSKCSNYRDYVWQEMERFDYTPENCLEFAESIEAVCTPYIKKLNEEHKKKLGVDKLKPWDMAVDPDASTPLKPFDPKNIPLFIKKTGEVFKKIAPPLSALYTTLEKQNNLDLDSRMAKQPGGYQVSLDECGEPFIFMNAAGVQRDVETLLHESGHAFHTLVTPLSIPIFLRHAPMEFCEVASMSMELLGADYLDVFYTADEVKRAKKKLLEGIIRFFPRMAMIDYFQHWIYTHPGHTEAERLKEWQSIWLRFVGTDVDWSGYEKNRDAYWHRVLHLFHVPFYYVEYGMAQIGALQVWLNYKKDKVKAIDAYLKGLSFGGTKALPELFKEAGLKFDFSKKMLEELIGKVWEELEGLR
ncbi:M3 family oligoendopeptidase [bacterium]|nr:M3 family oligoendopeptidase [bacterium]